MNRYFASTGRIGLGALLVTVSLAGFASLPAKAGFQWNPPPMQPQAAAQAPQGNMPVDMPASVEKGPLTPMIDDAPASQSRPIPVPSQPMQATARIEPVSTEAMAATNNLPQKIDDIPPMDDQGETDLMMPIPGEMASVPQSAPTGPSPNSVIAEGFGKDIPLAIALRQIVPPQYATVYEGGVDQGKPVTWNGGRPWNDVVSDMLSPRKLHAEWNGTNLMIKNGNGAALTMPPVGMGGDAMAMNQPPMAQANYAPRPVVDLSMRKKWTAKPGQTLQQVLKMWSMDAHAELAWEDAGDMPISGEFAYDGTFDQAVDSLLSLYNAGGNEPHAKLYPNLPQGPSVLMVSIR